MEQYSQLYVYSAENYNIFNKDIYNVLMISLKLYLSYSFLHEHIRYEFLAYIDVHPELPEVDVCH